MKLWRKRLAVALAMAMLLTLLTACGPSGPTTPERPGGGAGTTEPSGPDKDPTEKPGTGGETGGSGSGEETGKDPTEKPGGGESGGETGKDPAEKPGKEDTEDENDKKTEEQEAIEATVKALNAVRVQNKRKELVLNAEACERAVRMAQLQLDGVNGVYGSDQMKSEAYKEAWNDITGDYVNGKKVVGIGAYGAYPDETVFRKWITAAGDWKSSLVLSEKTTLVGVGVVKNTDPKTVKDYPYMVAVLTY